MSDGRAMERSASGAASEAAQGLVEGPPIDFDQLLGQWAHLDHILAAFRSLGPILRAVPQARTEVATLRRLRDGLKTDTEAWEQKLIVAREQDGRARAEMAAAREAERQSWHNTRADLKAEMESLRTTLEQFSTDCDAKKMEVARLRTEIRDAEQRLSGIRAGIRDVAAAAMKDEPWTHRS